MRPMCKGGLTLAPLAAVGIQVVGIEALRFVQPVKNLPDVHHLKIKETEIKLYADPELHFFSVRQNGRQ